MYTFLSRYYSLASNDKETGKKTPKNDKRPDMLVQYFKLVNLDLKVEAAYWDISDV